jgi:hypothetical protein
MTSSAKPTRNSPTPFAAVTLKLVGGITILAALVDFLVLLIPPNLLDRQWQIATTTQLVDRGIVPLVGIALLFTGYWIDSFATGGARKPGKLAADARFWSCILASVLGVMFLVMAVMHPNNVRLQSKDTLTQVTEEATQASSQLEQRLNTEVSQQRSQINTLVQNPDLLQQALSSGRITQEQANQIKQFRNDPAALDKFLQEQATKLQSQVQTEIGSRREQAQKRVRAEATKATIRISLSSLLLAVGYGVIGWSGLRRLLNRA